MRDHRAIVRQAGATRLHQALAVMGVNISPVTPQRWADRNSIPGEYWMALSDLGFASLEELAASVAVANTDTPAQGAAA